MAIGEGWEDGAWVDESWVVGAWKQAVAVATAKYRGFLVNVGKFMG